MATTHSNNLNVGMRCIKYMLFTINFMFVVSKRKGSKKRRKERTRTRNN